MAKNLEGKKIAFLATDGFEEVELTRPWSALKKAGAKVELVSLQTGEIQGVSSLDRGDVFVVDKDVKDVSAAMYDGLVLPGGLHNPDTLRLNEDAVAFVKEFFHEAKPVAAICHGPWMLIEAGVVKGRRLTSWPSLKTDIENAGGTWVDEEVCVDRGLVTSRDPDDLDAFCEQAIENFATTLREEREVRS